MRKVVPVSSDLTMTSLHECTPPRDALCATTPATRATLNPEPLHTCTCTLLTALKCLHSTSLHPSKSETHLILKVLQASLRLMQRPAPWHVDPNDTAIDCSVPDMDPSSPQNTHTSHGTLDQTTDAPHHQRLPQPTHPPAPAAAYTTPRPQHIYTRRPHRDQPTPNTAHPRNHRHPQMPQSEPLPHTRQKAPVRT